MKRLSLIPAILFAAACSGTEPGLLRLTMELETREVALDDSLRVELVVANASTRPVMVYPPSAYGHCGFLGFELFDHWGERVEPGWVCLAAALGLVPDPVPLDPGATMEITRWWKPAEFMLDDHPLGPGLYRIRGKAITMEGAVQSPTREIIVSR